MWSKKFYFIITFSMVCTTHEYPRFDQQSDYNPIIDDSMKGFAQNDQFAQNQPAQDTVIMDYSSPVDTYASPDDKNSEDNVNAYKHPEEFYKAVTGKTLDELKELGIYKERKGQKHGKFEIYRFADPPCNPDYKGVDNFCGHNCLVNQQFSKDPEYLKKKLKGSCDPKVKKCKCEG